eukprot:3602494-Rhodomonas_salina.5
MCNRQCRASQSAWLTREEGCLRRDVRHAHAPAPSPDRPWCSVDDVKTRRCIAHACKTRARMLPAFHGSIWTRPETM